MKAYNVITKCIIDELEKGVIPWKQSWKSGLPVSFNTNKPYQGINRIILSFIQKKYISNKWITGREVFKKGGSIIDGEKAMPIVYWHWRKPEEIQRLIDSGKAKKPAPCVPYLSFVYNLDQTEGIEDKVIENTSIELNKNAESVIDKMPNKPRILYSTVADPCYSISMDTVFMPKHFQFDNSELFYNVLFHELVHSTGHESRLNRNLWDNKKADNYAFEELIAELGAAFLCSDCAMDNTAIAKETSSYIAVWLKALKKDSSFLFKAANKAQKAADYIKNIIKSGD